MAVSETRSYYASLNHNIRSSMTFLFRFRYQYIPQFKEKQVNIMQDYPLHSDIGDHKPNIKILSVKLIRKKVEELKVWIFIFIPPFWASKREKLVLENKQTFGKMILAIRSFYKMDIQNNCKVIFILTLTWLDCRFKNSTQFQASFLSLLRQTEIVSKWHSFSPYFLVKSVWDLSKRWDKVSHSKACRIVGGNLPFSSTSKL